MVGWECRGIWGPIYSEYNFKQDWMILFSFNGAIFVKDIKRSVEIRKRQNKEPRQIRYIHYTTWAVALRKKAIGPDYEEGSLPHYSFDSRVLGFLRHLCPGNIKGELREDAYKPTMKEFCESLEITRLWTYILYFMFHKTYTIFH